MLYLQIASPKSSVLNFLDSNSFEVIISIFQRTEKVPDMERLQIREYSMDIYIVFVTAYVNYSLEGYKVDATRYLLKNTINFDAYI